MEKVAEKLKLEALEHLYTKMVEDQCSNLSLSDIENSIKKLKTEISMPVGKQLLQG